MIEIKTSYDFTAWPAMDEVIKAAAGRLSDFSGLGNGMRDHGWVCASEIEAARIERGLRRVGLATKRREINPGSTSQA